MSFAAAVAAAAVVAPSMTAAAPTAAILSLAAGFVDRRRRPPSSDWWEFDDAAGGAGGHPANRRSHSAAVYSRESLPIRAGGGGDDDEDDGGRGGEEEEWMVVSGGFTDGDWETFPVWAYDLSRASSSSPSSPWTDLATWDSDDGGGGGEDAATPPPPPTGGPRGRVGHLSSVHGGCLHVFGGLTYDGLGSFRVDAVPTTTGGGGGGGGDGDDGPREERTVVVWRACGLDGILPGGGGGGGRRESTEEGDGNHRGSGRRRRRRLGLRWEMIVPRVVSSPPARPDDRVDGDDSSGDDDDDDDDEPHGGGGGGAKYRDREDDPHRRRRASSGEEVADDPAHAYPRGEARGGHYYRPRLPDRDDRGKEEGDRHRDDDDDDDDESCFVFHGGMHNDPSPGSAASSGPGGMRILGDVWRYHYATETLTLLSPYPPLPWQRDERNGMYPVARTAHAGTVVGDELIIHGGMHFGDEEDDRRPSSSSSSSSFAAPSNSYATYKTTSRWHPLSDVWSFDLVTLRWKERILYPQLARSYHSVVGWGDGTIAAFGGFQQNNGIPGETVAFVFNDLILSRSNETYWRKLVPPDGEQIPRWPASSEHAVRPSISNRLEHTAVLDQYGSMYIWGGRFQTVSQIFGLWRLDIFTEDAKLKYEIAAPDGIDQYEAELQAMHMFIVMMMFMSLTLSSLLSMMRRQGLVEAGGGGGGGGSSSLTSSRRGLSREVIDSLPLKRYKAPSRSAMGEGGDVVDDASSLGGGSNNDRREGIAAPRLLENNNDAECCPICLVDFTDGSEVRTLPCGHDFDRECIDSWLLDHTTCPTCRENIDNTPLPPREEEGGAPTIAAASSVFLTQPDFFLPWPFARATADDGGRGWRSRWSGVPSADPADAAGLRSDDDDETPSNDRLESTTTNPRFLGGGWRSRWGGVPSADAGLGSDDETSNVDNDDREESTRPRFLGMRRFLGRGGHVGVAVPQNEEEGSRRESVSVELVLIV